ncbi:tripartite tricarboxylate transporter TctB family protein [Aquabacterium sp. J223]|uniref:tripartite tricarboxylate transporter TctB family protein n=1 Tax=Aquabacterium sp. J223 TaxID=2898431 RepID=UPI0021AD5CE4|nr:tripartite tricarboxylate transporter TctB family protein [Aquabacterium sp. J223]UUX97487.1 tripartite tricarboxylate transporter TctB family protein [Aquabacterium sp. J223]
MKIKSQKDFWSGLMFIAVGAGFSAGALNYSFGSSARPGPGYFPFGLGALLAVLGLVVLFNSLTIETEDGEPIGGIAWRPLVVLVVSIVLFGFLLPKLGMIVSLPLLVLATATASHEFHWRDALINAIVLTAFSWVVFIWGLSLTIPLWPAFTAAAG